MNKQFSSAMILFIGLLLGATAHAKDGLCDTILSGLSPQTIDQSHVVRIGLTELRRDLAKHILEIIYDGAIIVIMNSYQPVAVLKSFVAYEDPDLDQFERIPNSVFRIKLGQFIERANLTGKRFVITRNRHPEVVLEGLQKQESHAASR